MQKDKNRKESQSNLDVTLICAQSSRSLFPLIYIQMSFPGLNSTALNASVNWEININDNVMSICTETSCCL